MDEQAFVTVQVNTETEEIEVISNLDALDIAALLLKTIELLAGQIDQTSKSLEGVMLS